MSPARIETPPARQPHALHRADRTWEQTNCSLDLWIELLHHLGLEPLAAFGGAVRLDFEGDQYTFLRIPGSMFDHEREKHSLCLVVMP